jgi:hypothetical protein
MFKSFYTFLLATLALLAACDAPEPKTRLDFVAGTGLTSESKAITAGEIITTSLFVRTASANNKLKRFVISQVYDTTINSPVVYLDTTFDAEEFGMTFVFGSRGVNNLKPKGKEYWNFKVIDEQGQEYQKQYILTSNFPNFDQPFNSFSSSYFHRNARENIRYFSTEQGKGFPGYIGRDHPFLQAEADFHFEEGPQLTLNLLALNGTKFKATNLSPAEFSAVATANNLTAHYDNAGAETESQPAVQKDAVIAFKTGQGKVGLIQIGTFEIARDTINKVNILRRAPYQVKVRK